jgi:hypothetical protein
LWASGVAGFSLAFLDMMLAQLCHHCRFLEVSRKIVKTLLPLRMKKTDRFEK